jgi:nucleoid-associated protein EbfC
MTGAVYSKIESDSETIFWHEARINCPRQLARTKIEGGSSMAKGFNRPGGSRPGGGGGGMMAQIKALQEQMEVTQAQLAVETVTASVGGGAIKVTMTGAQVCKSVTIDPELLKDADAEMLQDLVLSAVNMALDQSRKLADDRMGPLAGGLSGLGL